MKNLGMKNALIAVAALMVAGTIQAQTTVLVTSDISMSTTWTSNNIYDLQTQIYVLPGATLTIQPGTVIASTVQANGGGALAVTRGGQIIAKGTKEQPIIFTSQADRATWVGGDPRTGTWREAANEWGNLTLMGAGYISENATAGNVASPNASNVAVMEGLQAQFPGDTRVLYGGGNDDDDSGCVTYCSFRYTGRVIGFANELNGLSLGGIGRNTDLHHIDIMNNVDDGVEIWGGTVNMKYVNIWNIGDDSVDVDQGWRGKMQFVLVVQGHCLNAAQGSGVGDNCFEMDGAEQSDYQPVTTSTIYNCTVIGQPIDGDHGTAWRDNARVQFCNSVFMDLGERLVQLDNVDGDGGLGYGHNGTLSWINTWTTPYTATSTVNAPANPAAFYTVQTTGNLIQIADSITFRNNFASAYTEATARGVFAPGNNNVQIAGSAAIDAPIQTITRGPQVVRGGKIMEPVIFLDPRPKNQALTSVGWAPADGFFSGAHYRGAFAPGNLWTTGWTAASAFGFMPSDPWCDLGNGSHGVLGQPVLSGSGPLTGGSAFSINLSNAAANASCFFAIGFQRLDAPFLGGIVVPDFITGLLLPLATDGSGQVSVGGVWAPGIPSGVRYYLQYLVFDAAALGGAALSNAILATTP